MPSPLLAIVIAGAFIGASASAAPVSSAAPSEAGVCAGCHGTHGEGGANVPRLAGQDADYLDHALSMFRDGTRASDVMQPIARTLDAAQSRKLAEYFSGQQAPRADPTSSANASLALAGQELAEHGAGNVAACFSCHGAQGQGEGARFPRIAGQPAQFLVERMHEFQERARQKTPAPGTMTAVSTTLSEQQIQETAAYLSQLGP
jgi:cytochrome c553